MSQEEHILHQLKALHDWTVQANRWMAIIVWLLSILTAITLGVLLRVLFG